MGLERDEKAILTGAALIAVFSLGVGALCLHLGDAWGKKASSGTRRNFWSGPISLLFGGTSTAEMAHGWVKWSLPILVAGCVATFIKGQVLMSWGFKYKVEMTGFEYKESFEYNIDTSVSALWLYDNEVFAVLLAALSLLWPHIKLLYALVLYYLPLNVTYKSRVSLYLWLDTLGRWNHLDIIVVNFMLSTVDLNSGFFEAYAYTLDGSYVYCMAVIMSQGIGHLVIEETRVAMRNAEAQEEGALEDDEKVAFLRDKEGTVGHTPYGSVAPTIFPRAALYVPAMQLISFTLYITALALTSYITFYTLPLDLEYDDLALTISETSTKCMNSHADKWYDRVGVIFIGLLVLCFTTIVPAVRMLCQAWQWFGRLSPKQRCTLDHVVEVATLWSALDVSLFAGFLVALGVKDLTKDIIECPWTEDPCFYIEMDLENGFMVGLAAVLMGYIVNITMAHIDKTIQAQKTYQISLNEKSPLISLNDLNAVGVMA
eukprot:gene672-1126_t